MKSLSAFTAMRGIDDIWKRHLRKGSHAYMHTYMHAYTHAYIHTCMPASSACLHSYTPPRCACPQMGGGGGTPLGVFNNIYIYNGEQS